MNELTTATGSPSASLAEATSLNPNQIIFNPAVMQTALQIAEFMAGGKISTPKHLRGNKGDCLAVTMQALRWGFDPTAVAAKTHNINDQLGYEGQLIIAAINTSGRLKAGETLDFEWFGPWERIVGRFKTIESKKKMDDDGNPKKYIVPAWDPKDEEGCGVRCSATLRGQSKPRVMELLMTQCRTRNSTLWTEDPKQQIGYLVGRRWGRLYTPEVILGVYTRDELEDRDDAPPPKHMGPAEVVTERPSRLPEKRLAEWRAAAAKGLESAKKFWGSTLSREEREMATEEQKVEMRSIADKADRERTVDDTAASGAPAQAAAATATEAKSTDEAKPQDKPAADVDPEFVAAMDKADAQAEKGST